jgi:hypothetical protein
MLRVGDALQLGELRALDGHYRCAANSAWSIASAVRTRRAGAPARGTAG